MTVTRTPRSRTLKSYLDQQIADLRAQQRLLVPYDDDRTHALEQPRPIPERPATPPASQGGLEPSLPADALALPGLPANEEEETALGIRRPVYVPGTGSRTRQRRASWQAVAGILSWLLAVILSCGLAGSLGRKQLASYQQLPIPFATSVGMIVLGVLVAVAGLVILGLLLRRTPAQRRGWAVGRRQVTSPSLPDITANLASLGELHDLLDKNPGMEQGLLYLLNLKDSTENRWQTTFTTVLTIASSIGSLIAGWLFSSISPTIAFPTAAGHQSPPGVGVAAMALAIMVIPVLVVVAIFGRRSRSTAPVISGALRPSTASEVGVATRARAADTA